MFDLLALHVSFQRLIAIIEWTTALGNAKVALGRLSNFIFDFDPILIKVLAYKDD